MCTPVGHTIAGYTVFISQYHSGSKNRWINIIVVLLFSNLPDVDLLFGYVVGNPNQYHHLWTHSLAFVLGVGSLFGLGYWVFMRRGGLRVGCIVSCVVLSHIVLDFFTKDTSFPYGIQLFWPMSQKFFISPITIFRDVSKASSSGAFLGSLFCWHNLWTVLVELVLLGPPLVWILLRYRVRKDGVVKR